MNLEFCRNIFEKYSNTEFHENPFIGSPVVPSVQTGGQTDRTKLTADFRNFANAPKVINFS